MEKCLTSFQSRRENVLPGNGHRSTCVPIIGEGKPMKDVFEILSMVAPCDATILIRGETGTGKEVVANAIHRNSPRADRPMIKVNCSALPETLLESELFGHERGAFTGAAQRKPGRFELANGGTLFLDEVGDMSLTTQVKLLRVLQEREFEPLGSVRPIRADIRLVAATHRDLEQEVREGRFREDLFHRLNVVSVTLPPLRERGEDIPLLAEHFLRTYGERHEKQVRGFLPEASAALMRYSWPGNVRELENTVERAVLFCRGDYVLVNDLPPSLRPAGEERRPLKVLISLGTTMKEIEREAILQTLKQTRGNRTHAAHHLGISLRSLQYKMREYGL